MNREELGKLYPIIIERYDKNWVSMFEREKQNIINILGSNIALRVEHMGSTAVPNLSSKPIVDILVEIPQISEYRDIIIDLMSKKEYTLMQEQRNHIMFVKGYSPTGLEKESFHIHMGTKEQDFLWDRLYFRNYLRMNPSVAMEYEELKIKLAETFRHDREAYTESKTEFISKITRLAKESLTVE
ncbi:GrpB-like predicted nucleotidyltransferase (UPF0157 family) [Paenibacillus rhizosphaerae]|uniref:GrpB-like predicted nucleotidyltransferase (UPF0157 family) n=1 Tax=Paenibacillus rhizosphaerae TaxID=297318 RepID=A0A839TX01_9BACL|nr:GrpB family protein [Paenibacillus rhizosphaerae]MBB3131375.1 GrpB-like predicted nucleotidyltransferase (UPF0157 family) [Paenibacillus rhizosphaerae]